MKFYRVFKRALSAAALKQLLLIMKCIVIIMTTFLIQVSANSFAQNITYHKKDASLTDVFKEIIRQTGYNVLFESENPGNLKPIHAAFNRQPLESVLKQILTGQNLEYTIQNQIIIIRTKNAEVPVASPSVAIAVKGRVTDTKGEPLPGATIQIKGTSRVSIADENGNYTISVPDNSAILVFSYIGYQSREMKVDAQTVINVSLTEEMSTLGELVVVGYGTQSKAKITSAVSQVNTDLLKKAPAPSISNALEGLSPGLFVRQESGEPGFSNSSFEIRNFGSALVIVDGSPGSIDKLEPNEIESITVLKDAAAASVYGVRGGNGVVLVKTRRGKAGKPVLNYSNQFTFNTQTNYPEYFNSTDFAVMTNQMLLNAGQQPKYTADEIRKFGDGSDPLKYANTNWRELTLKDWSPQQRHNLNVSGGNDDAKYFVSAGFINQGSLYKADVLNFNQYNIRANVDARILDNLNLNFSIAGRRQDREAPGYSAYDIYRSLHRSLPIDLAYYPDGTPAKPSNSPMHPVEGLKDNNAGYYLEKNNNVDAKISLKWDIKQVKGLSITSFASIVYDNLYQKRWSKAYTIYTLNPRTGNYDPYSVVPEGSASKTILTETSSTRNDYVLQQSLNYQNSFGDHNLTGLLLLEKQSVQYNDFWGRRQDFQSDFIDQLFAGSNKNKDASGTQWRDSRLGLVGRASYDYKAKYLAEFSFRKDGSSKFAPGHNWGFFPSGSLGWRISDEKFFAPLKKSVQDLKIRASVGTAGNDGDAAYQWLSGFSYNGFFVIGDEAIPTIDNSKLPNINLTWSNIVTYDAGLDFALFRKSTTFSFDYFHRVQSDVLAAGSSTIPSTLGVELAPKNLYKYSNTGFEFSVNHSSKISESLSFNLGASFSQSREKAVYIDEALIPDEFMRANLMRTGNFVNRRTGYVADGIFQNVEEIATHAIQDGNGNSSLQPGDIRFKDLNGDNIIDEKDTRVTGRGDKPDINYSFNLGINYKNFSLSALLTGAAGYTVYLDGEAQSALKNGFNGYKYQMDFWTPENTGAAYPRPSLSGSNANNDRTSDFWQRSGTHLRVKNITLGYELPKAFREKIRFGAARLFVTGQNLFVLSGIKEGFDPQYKGGNGYYYPQTKSITFGLDITL